MADQGDQVLQTSLDGTVGFGVSHHRLDLDGFWQRNAFAIHW